jgi:hypothetical protein
MSDPVLFVGGGLAAMFGARWLRRRLMLSRAKHPSLRGHARWARRIAGWLPFYEYGDDVWFGTDGAPEAVQQQRERGFARLAQQFRQRCPRTLAASAALESGIADVAFVNHYRGHRRGDARPSAAGPRWQLEPRPDRQLRRQPVRQRRLQAVHRTRRSAGA